MLENTNGHQHLYKMPFEKTPNLMAANMLGFTVLPHLKYNNTIM